MALLDEEGVDPRRVCIGHCDTSPRWTTAWPSFAGAPTSSIDNIGHQLGDHEDHVVRLVVGLLEAGHETQILLSQDVGQVPELRARGGRGYTYLSETFLPRLRSAGVTEDTIRTITVENPRRWLTITPPADTPR